MPNNSWKIARRSNAQLPLVIVLALAVVLVLLGKAQSGLFDRATYQQRLNEVGLTEPAYEAELRARSGRTPLPSATVRRLLAEAAGGAL